MVGNAGNLEPAPLVGEAASSGSPRRLARAVEGKGGGKWSRRAGVGVSTLGRGRPAGVQHECAQRRQGSWM